MFTEKEIENLIIENHAYVQGNEIMRKQIKKLIKENKKLVEEKESMQLFINELNLKQQNYIIERKELIQQVNYWIKRYNDNIPNEWKVK